MGKDSKNCFVIAPIGDPESDTRKRSDQILKHVIEPSVGEMGYKSIRADKISEPGMITSQVIQNIIDDQLVIADLTERNPNVFYELATRHAIRKPLVQIIRKGEQIPFDVAGTRTIHVDHKDLDSVEEARGEIIAQIKSLERDSSNLETPISVSLDLQNLRQSENPEQRSLADILSALADMRSAVASMEKRISDPERLIPPQYIRHLSRRSERDVMESRRWMHEARVILEELTELSESEPKGSTANKHWKNRLAELREKLNFIMHLLAREDLM